MAIVETLQEALNKAERKREQSFWLPAAGGTEKPFKTKTGHRVLYMFQPMTRKHAYLNLENDTFITDEELASFGL